MRLSVQLFEKVSQFCTERGHVEAPDQGFPQRDVVNHSPTELVD